MISAILAKKTRLIFEDKLIIENALSLWVGCILHNNHLLSDFYAFKNHTVRDSDDFILQGLLFCEQEKVRDEFKLSLGCLARKLKVEQPPLLYLLKLLSDKFALISNYHCKQYFELFCELIDQYFTVDHHQAEFNPETLLGLIIDKIKEYNRMESTAATDNNNNGEQCSSEQEDIYIGLIQLTGKIIDNFDISFSEKVVEQKNLIDEIFVRFLFSSVFNQDAHSEDCQKIRPKRGAKEEDEAKKGGRMFGKRSKDAAYKLLNSLIRKSPLLMNSFLDKSMLPLMALIKRKDGWNYSPPGT